MKLLADLLVSLRFFSRLPVPETARERALGAGGFASASALAPVAGMILAIPQVAVLALSSALALPPVVCSLLALTASVLLTGALHEDALADCADGFGGGRDRERKLAIMRDSRIGAFGTVAIVLSLLLRASALAAAVAAGFGGTAIFVAAILSRAACLAPLAILRPARSDGAGAASAVTADRFSAATILAFALSIAIASAEHVDVMRSAGAVLLAALAAVATTALAWRQIGGQTGDVAGAAQQVAEIMVLIVFAAGAS